MFKVHPELPGIIVDWYVTTLMYGTSVVMVRFGAATQ